MANRRKTQFKKQKRHGGHPLLLFIVSVLILVAGYNEFLRDIIFPPEPPDRAPVETVKQTEYETGTELDSYHDVPVYANGNDLMAQHGLHFNVEETYYFGFKWHDVEYVRRFLYEVFAHRIPEGEGEGNAKSYFDRELTQGAFNEALGLWQFQNGGAVKPHKDDILVFDDGEFGHVAVICQVGTDWLETIQQNTELVREVHALQKDELGNWTVSGGRGEPAGWLRFTGDV
jgi:hypothetical protein